MSKRFVGQVWRISCNQAKAFCNNGPTIIIVLIIENKEVNPGFQKLICSEELNLSFIFILFSFALNIIGYILQN